MASDMQAQFGLTEEEFTILRLLVQGYNGTEMGKQLSYSRGTVTNKKLPRLYRKLGVQSRGEAKAFVQREASAIFKEWKLDAERLYEADLSATD